MSQDMKDKKGLTLGKDYSRWIISFSENKKLPNAEVSLHSKNIQKFGILRAELGRGRIVRKVGRSQVT